MGDKGAANQPRWNEVIGPDGKPRAPYRALLDRLPAATDLRELEDRLEATLRELGVVFEAPAAANGRNTWFCDLLPQIFTGAEWTLLVRGFQQRVRAFEALLQDVYGPREIVKQGVLPIPLALGSPQYQHAAVGLTPARNCFLHLSGMCLTRDATGTLAVKSHYFSHPSGLSYMIQNRRLLARVLPELFQDSSVVPITDVPTEILLRLRSVSPRPEPASALLTPGTGSAVYSEHSFLARRMGVPLVQGNDLVVRNDTLFLKTVSGLERVDAIYTRLADPWLDPLVFRPDSRLGVPGLVHCLRQGNLVMINAVGAQLADDRSLLHFSNAIIRFYLGEWPVLPTLPTYWLGDLDQQEMVRDNLDRFRIRALVGEKILPAGEPETVLLELRRRPHLYVAQPRMDTVETICLANGRRVRRDQDFLVYGFQTATGFEVFDGALTRVSATEHGRTESEHGGGGKDTWVLRENPPVDGSPVVFRRPKLLPGRRVTSRVAEAFYWVGRYLERAMAVSKIITVIETVEMEELTSAERKLYRPVWNRLLPPLDYPGKPGRRSIG
ncbi:MAG: circularly permuted type 2 ATP-grasp protein, partial [Verrucomicrobia bacterium]|nr:circularly permuted type 2 ATP-grasp protein [Verrucomicrobiota bacterium]